MSPSRWWREVVYARRAQYRALSYEVASSSRNMRSFKCVPSIDADGGGTRSVARNVRFVLLLVR